MIFVEPPFWAAQQRRAAAPRLSAILTVPPTDPVLTVAEGKLRAGLDWLEGDPRDALIEGFIATRTRQVELDTGIALLTQTYDVLLDAMPGGPVALPWRPVQSVTVRYTDSGGTPRTVDAGNYLLDPGGEAPLPARIGLALGGSWPVDVRPFAPWAIEIVVGFPTVAELRTAAPALVDAVGLLVAHAATAGRDRFTAAALRDEYAELIGPYQQVSVA